MRRQEVATPTAHNHIVGPSAGPENTFQSEEPIQIVGIIHRPADHAGIVSQSGLHARQIDIAVRDGISQEENRHLTGPAVLPQAAGSCALSIKTPGIAIDERHAVPAARFHTSEDDQGTEQPGAQAPRSRAVNRGIRIGSR